LGKIFGESSRQENLLWVKKFYWQAGLLAARQLWRNALKLEVRKYDLHGQNNLYLKYLLAFISMLLGYSKTFHYAVT